MNIYKKILLQLFTIYSVFSSSAQDKPIGYWQAHMSYYTAVGIATDGLNLYTICPQSFYTFSNSGELTTYSKVEGMSDVGMACIAYDLSTSTVVLAYQNSNIDLFKDNTFYNLPDLKNRVVSGAKNINHIFCENGMAYLSTDIGIIVIDLNKKEIEESYVFYLDNQVVPVHGFSGPGDYFYAATTKGVFRAKKSNPQLQNFAVWERFDSTHNCSYIASVDTQLFLAKSDSLFVVKNSSLQYLYSPADTADQNVISHIDAVSNGIWISEYSNKIYKGVVKKMDPSFHFIDSFKAFGQIGQVTEKQDRSIWVADLLHGMGKRVDTSTAPYYPEGPTGATAADIYANNGEMWIAYGGFTDLLHPLSNRAGFSKLKDDKWTTYTYQRDALYDSLLDFVAIAKDPTDGTIYAGSFQNGLFVLNPDGSSHTIRGPLIDVSTVFGNYPVAGLAFDNSNNLWVTLFGSPHELLVKTTDGNWYKFALNYPRNIPFSGGPIVVDDNNRKWYVSMGGGGVIVYDDNYTPENASDDQSRNLSAGVGYGNLPSNKAFCIAKDKNDDIWVGTDNGIGIINCGGNIFDGCDAQIPIVQYDQYAGYLFAGENVRSIAVDGANRKWVGTDNGVWLLSPDASKIIYRFTKDNSPLPTNHIQKIAIDNVTGDVYIGTEQGLMTYRSTSTEGGTTNTNVVSYPNPVPTGYKGTIAIKGLVANADVRITDMSGQLVYRTTALGGQAVWNGMDYTGHRPQSGVYLIFITNANGSETYVGKMVFLQ